MVRSGPKGRVSNHEAARPVRITRLPRDARRERERKAGGGGDLGLARGRNLVQRAAGKPAAERGVDRRNAERQRMGAVVQARRPFGRAQLLPQQCHEGRGGNGGSFG